MQHYSDEEILALFRDESSRNMALHYLIQKYQQKLYWHIRKIVISHDDTDDVLQNTFIKVYRSIEQFEQKSSLFTWLYRIATNESLTFIERNKKFQYDFVDDQDEHPAISQLKSDPYFDGNEIQLALQDALSRLPDKQKQVFLLRYHDEMSYKEMSEVLQTSEGALKASYHHAVKKIEEYFKQKELI